MSRPRHLAATVRAARRAVAFSFLPPRMRMQSMKALVYNGPKDVAVKDVPDARIEKPTDVLVRITTTNICGSDLHMYEGRTGFETGRWFGHENMGQVVEVGDGVDKV